MQINEISTISESKCYQLSRECKLCLMILRVPGFRYLPKGTLLLRQNCLSVCLSSDCISWTVMAKQLKFLQMMVISMLSKISSPACADLSRNILFAVYQLVTNLIARHSSCSLQVPTYR